MLTHRIGGIRLSLPRSARPETAMTDLRDASRDERLLAAHGYRQELERGLSLWSSFSVGFATISPVVGIYSVMSSAP